MELERRTPVKPIRAFRAIAAGVKIAGEAVINGYPEAQKQHEQNSLALKQHVQAPSTSHTTDVQPYVQISHGPESHDSQHPRRWFFDLLKERDLEKRYWGGLEERRWEELKGRGADYGELDDLN